MSSSFSKKPIVEPLAIRKSRIFTTFLLIGILVCIISMWLFVYRDVIACIFWTGEIIRHCIKRRSKNSSNIRLWWNIVYTTSIWHNPVLIKYTNRSRSWIYYSNMPPTFSDISIPYYNISYAVVSISGYFLPAWRSIVRQHRIISGWRTMIVQYWFNTLGIASGVNHSRQKYRLKQNALFGGFDIFSILRLDTSVRWLIWNINSCLLFPIHIKKVYLPYMNQKMNYSSHRILFFSCQEPITALLHRHGNIWWRYKL